MQQVISLNEPVLVTTARGLLGRALQDLDLSCASAKACFVFGSHAYPMFARANSDIDLLAILDGVQGGDPTKWCLEYVTRGTVGGERVACELQLFTRESILPRITAGSLVRCYGVVRGMRALWDDIAIEGNIRTTAAERLRGVRESTVLGLDALTLSERLSWMRLRFTEVRDALICHAKVGASTLALVRLGEVLTEFAFHAEACVLGAGQSGRDDASTKSVYPALVDPVTTLVMLGQPRGGRMLTADKYPTSAWLRSLVHDIDRRIAKSNGLDADLLVSVLDGMAAGFERAFGVSLFLADGESQSSLLLPED